MKVLFLAMSTGGYGETLIGLSLARQLARAKIASHFIIEDRREQLLSGTEFPFTTLNPKMGPLAELIVDDVVKEFCPEIIVLSDYFTYYRVITSQFNMDPWFIDSYDIPIIP